MIVGPTNYYNLSYKVCTVTLEAMTGEAALIGDVGMLDICSAH